MARKKVPPGSLLKRPLGRVFIGEWREYRDHMTQDQLAAAVADLTGRGFSGATLSRIENSKNPYAQWQLEALAEILDCSPGDLISRNPLDKEPDDLLLARLSPRNREAALTMIRALVAKEREDKAA